jgi:hypothetical protein
MYIGFLLSEPNGVSCSRMVSGLSIYHDGANRFLNREVDPTINIQGGKKPPAWFL